MGRFGLATAKPCPTLKKFLNGKFLEHVRTHHKAKPRTVKFYEEKVRRLLDATDWTDKRLNEIDEAAIKKYVTTRSKHTIRPKQKIKPASINRELATLRHALHLAHEWRYLNRVPKIRMLPGEINREFVLSDDMETHYLEAVNLEWEGSVNLTPAQGAELGYIFVRKGKSKNARRVVPLTQRSLEMLVFRRAFYADSRWVFPGRKKDSHFTIFALDNQHRALREKLLKCSDCGLVRIRGKKARVICTACGSDAADPLFGAEFVIHSLRHTFGTRLGESGADAFTIMKLMGHSSVTVSQKYVHPTPENLERAMQRLEARNQDMKRKEAPTISPTVKSEGV